MTDEKPCEYCGGDHPEAYYDVPDLKNAYISGARFAFKQAEMFALVEGHEGCKHCHRIKRAIQAATEGPTE